MKKIIAIFGTRPEAIKVIPVVKALDQVKNKLKASSPLLSVLPKNSLNDRRDIITVTAHRRENWGAGIQNICLALKIIAEKRDEIFAANNVTRPFLDTTNRT